VNKFIGLMVIIVSIFMVNPQAHAQEGGDSPLQLRAMQTRKFANVDLKKLTNAIEAYLNINGFVGHCKASEDDSMYYCSAFTNRGIYLSFMLQSNIRDKTSLLRVSYIKYLQIQSPQEAKDFYSKFFKSMGDILFVDSQKLDMQEIN